MKRRATLYSMISVLAMAGCGGKRGGAQATTAAPTAVERTVGTFSVVRHAFRRTVEFPATVLAEKQVTLLSKVPGEIRKIHVSEGNRVRKDQALIELDQKDFRLALRQAQAQLAAARAGVEAATVGAESVTTRHKRFSALRKENAVSENDFDQVETGQKASAAQLRGAQAQLLLAQVAVEGARNNLGYTVVRAPFAGVVGSRLVDEGTRTQAMPPTPLLVLVDTSRVKVVGGVTERDLAFLRRGAAARVIVEALPATPFDATVDVVEPLVDPRTRTAGVRIVLDNEGGKLQAGMSARVVVEQGKVDAPALPDDAILRAEMASGRGTVFIVNAGKAHRREVALGARDGDLVEVVSGLKGGELVVRGGQGQLKDGDPVTVAAEGAKP